MVKFESKAITYLFGAVLLLLTGCDAEPDPGPTYMHSASPALPIKVSAPEAPRVAVINEAGYYVQDNGRVVNWGEINYSIPELADIAVMPSSNDNSTIYAALKHDGTVVTWGAFARDDLPKARAIFIGNSQGAGITLDGKVFVWGYEAEFYTPPANLDQVVSVEVGNGYFLALKSDGSVVSWLRRGSSVTENAVKYLPKDLKNVVQIAAASAQGVALKSDGTVVTWGILAPLFWAPLTLPKDLTLDFGAIAVAASEHYSAALLADGSLKIWGAQPSLSINNKYPNAVNILAKPKFIVLVNKDGSFEFVPLTSSMCYACQTASSLSNIADISVNLNAVLYRDKSLAAFDAGYSTIVEQTGAVSLTDSDGYVYVRNNQKQIRAFGSINWGQFVPPVLAQLDNNRLFDAYNYSWIGLGEDGAVSTNAQFAVAEGSTANLNNIKLVGAGDAFYVVVNQADEIQLLARDDADYHHRLEENLKSPLFTDKPRLNSITAICLGDKHGLALTGDGKVTAWGDNTFGQLNVPVGLDKVIAIDAGANTSLALKSDGSVVAWGQVLLPAPITDAVAIKASSHAKSALAIRLDGTIVAWGQLQYPEQFYSLPFAK